MKLSRVIEILFGNSIDEVNFVSEWAMGDRNRDMHYLYALSTYLRPLLEEDLISINYYLDQGSPGPYDPYEYYKTFFDECIPNVDVKLSYRKESFDLPEDVFSPPFPKNQLFYFPISLPNSMDKYSFSQEKMLIHRTGKSKSVQYESPYENSTRRCIGNRLFYDVIKHLSDYFSEFVYIGSGDDYIPMNEEHFLEDNYLDLISFVRSFPLVFCEVSYIHNICSVQNTPFLTFSLADEDWTLQYAENLISDIFSRYVVFVGDDYNSPNTDYEENREEYLRKIKDIIEIQMNEMDGRILSGQVDHYLTNGYFETTDFNSISFSLDSSVLKVFDEFRDEGVFLPVLDEVFENLDNSHAPSEFNSQVKFNCFERESSKLRNLLIGCADYIMNSRSVNRIVRNFGSTVLENTHLNRGQNLYHISSKVCDSDVRYFHTTEACNLHDSYENLNVKWLSSGSDGSIASYSSIFNC